MSIKRQYLLYILLYSTRRLGPKKYDSAVEEQVLILSLFSKAVFTQMNVHVSMHRPKTIYPT